METINTFELADLDMRYETYRMKNKKTEDRLMLSILEHGILDPLRGVRAHETNFLLDGFKRARCAKKLNIATVPYLSMGNDEITGIIDLMRDSFAKELNVIEQAKLIDELQTAHGLSPGEIANRLGKSGAWVSVRIAMNRELTPRAAEQILSGRFPTRSYLYTILPFTRVNAIKSEEIDRFIERTAGKGLTTRNIESLAREYFKGTNEMREQIANGNLQWVLEQLQNEANDRSNGCTSPEHSLIRELKATLSGMRTVNRYSLKSQPESGEFLAQANLLVFDILNEMKPFKKNIKELYDRSR